MSPHTAIQCPPAIKNTLKLWKQQEWYIPDVSVEFVAAMMKCVLDLYEAP